MKAVLASIATVLVLTANSWSGTGLFWEPTHQAAQELAPACGQARALNIARIEWARDIHIGYLNMIKAGDALPVQDSDPAWHGYWVHVYDKTIALLKQDCNG